MQPRFGHALFATHRRDRNPQGLRGFFHAEAAEEAQLDHFALARVDLGQGFERIVQRFQIAPARGGEAHHLIQRDVGDTAAAFRAAPLARVIHQDLPHQLRRHAEKVRAALPIRQLLRDQTEVRFVHQRGGLSVRAACSSLR
jgi:hypothetical protein